MKKVLTLGFLAVSAFSVSLTAKSQQENVAAAEESSVSSDNSGPFALPSGTAPLATVPVSAVASETLDPGSGQSKSGNRFIEEIIVTAQKRSEEIQDVPISIAAFSTDQLDAKGVINTRDLSLVTPGLTFTEIGGFTIIYLRGVGTDAFIPSADPSIATYIDGIFIPLGQGLAQTLGSVERVEVLKGPQGTLFGRNSTGGAISVITKDPGPNLEGSLQAGYGRFNSFQSRADVNVPVADSFGLRLSGFYNHDDPYYKVVTFGQERPVQQEYSKGGRIKARLAATENLSFTLAGSLLEQRSVGSLLAANVEPMPLYKAIIPAQTQDYQSSNNIDGYSDTRTELVSGQLEWKLAPFDVKLIGADQEVLIQHAQYDFDGSALPLVSFTVPEEYTKVKTAELQLTSNATTWGADRFEWVGGLYYLNSKAGFDPIVLSVAENTITLPSGAIVSLIPQGARDALGGVPLPSGVNLISHGLLGTRSYSGYFQGTYSFTDWFSLTAGGRFQRETRKLLASTLGTENIAGGDTKLLAYAPRQATVKNFSPKISLATHFSDDVMVYLSYQEAFKSATYNIVNFYTQPDYVNPEKVSAYELGIKSDFMDHNMRFNSAIFQTDIRDLQSSFVSLLSGGVVRFQNAGKARIRGAEFDMTWLPIPNFDDGFVVSASGTYLHAIYTDFENGDGFNENTGLPFSNGDFSGNRIVRTPRFSGVLGLSQTIDLESGSLEIAVDTYYNSGFFYLPQNSPNSREAAYQLLNARVSYLYEPWQLRITAFGDNLTKEKYSSARFINDFGDLQTLAKPVTYGLRLNWGF